MPRPCLTRCLCVRSQVRKLFDAPDTIPASEIDLKWTAPDEEGLREFLVGQMGFNADRVNNGIKKLTETSAKGTQQRMDSFFTVVQSDSSSKKRKADPAKDKNAKKGKAGGKGKFFGKR